jgi:hypothetical protein
VEVFRGLQFDALNDSRKFNTISIAGEILKKNLGFQLANTWPKITAHDVYAMEGNGKECKNL